MRLPEGPEFRNQPQDAGKQISRDGGLGHLEGGITAVADDLEADLDEFLLIRVPHYAKQWPPKAAV